MKKNLILGFMVVFAFMAMTNFVLAGPGCGSKDTKATVGCSKACATICGIKVDDKAKTDGKLIDAKVDCDYKGKCEVISLSIKGMTCGDCESSVSSALMEQEGVIKVVSVDHKSGMATVCFDPTKVESAKLAKLVSKKGFKAEIVAAVTDGETAHKAHKGCPGAAKAKTTESENN